jgi:segregation and condensation protein A
MRQMRFCPQLSSTGFSLQRLYSERMSDASQGSESPSTPAAQPRTAVSNRIDFAASLDSFQGPLDLLLYLIKENEVEITEIPIALILEQYLRFLDQAPQWDLQLAGEFLVMAATLMEIKSRELLPVQEQPADAEEIIEDPRSELVRQLLQYRQLKDQAKTLEKLQDEWQMHRPRAFFGDIPDEPDSENPDEDRATAKEALLELDLFGLFAAYEKTMKAVLAQTPRRIEYSGESIEAKIERIEVLLKSRPFARFIELIADPLDRADIAATFVALLELTRRRAVRLSQQQEFGLIDVKAAAEGESEAAAREQAAAAEAAEQEALKLKAEHDAKLLAEGGGRPVFTRRQAKPRFEGVLRPEDLEEIDAEEHEIGRRIDAILAAADAISERFEQSREGRIRDVNTQPEGMPPAPVIESEKPDGEKPETEASPAEQSQQPAAPIDEKPAEESEPQEAAPAEPAKHDESAPPAETPQPEQP